MQKYKHEVERRNGLAAVHRSNHVASRMLVGPGQCALASWAAAEVHGKKEAVVLRKDRVLAKGELLGHLDQ